MRRRDMELTPEATFTTEVLGLLAEGQFGEAWGGVEGITEVSGLTAGFIMEGLLVEFIMEDLVGAVGEGMSGGTGDDDGISSCLGYRMLAISQSFAMNEGPYTQLPENLPVPVDDGACAHLPGKRLPDIALHATSNQCVNLRRQPGLIAVLYAYPMTGRPGVALPPGWDAIPGARGCTPESCGFRDLHAEMRRLGAEIFGLSTQTSDYQREVHDRLGLPF